MKILWLSNAALGVPDSGSTGTWLDAMAQRLVASGDVLLGNISMGKVRHIESRNGLPFRQWVVPVLPSGKAGFPPEYVVNEVLRVIDDFSPDLIHVWGVEAWWGLLSARGQLRQPSLLEIQGIKSCISRVYFGGLSPEEQKRCRGLKELLLGRSINNERRKFASWEHFESEIVLGHKYITTPSPYVAFWVKSRNKFAGIYHNELLLRLPFYEASPWCPNSSFTIFCSAAYPAPYKGIHDAIRVLALLKARYPNLRLKIAGALQRYGLRKDGYIAWIDRQARRLGVADKIEWLGPLAANAVVSELQSCSVMLMPSHCETYSVTFAEALFLGVPSVSAFNGGTNWLARNEETALFYPPGDEVMCAYQIERLLDDQALAVRLSSNARAVALERNNPVAVVANQLAIYRQVLAAEVKR